MKSPKLRKLLLAPAPTAVRPALFGCHTATDSRASSLVPGGFTGPKSRLRTEPLLGTLPAAVWRRFLSEVVTRIPKGGFIVPETQGRREAPSGEIDSLPSRVLVPLHPTDAASETGVDSIRAAFKGRSQNIPVIRSTSPATV